MSRTIHLIPHTHWDREWYEPFEVFRYRLVKVLDHVLEVLDEHPSFRHFTFDGQTIAIEDYLEIRPDAEPKLAAAIRDGRLSIGPFRVLADEFLCSPETLVRNLQQGAQTCAWLGGRLDVGYSPDPFGHTAQLPQLLRLAGLSRACLWRGVPSSVDRTVFRWHAPDGSWVTTMYLPFGYGHAAGLPDTVDELRARAERIATDLEPWARDGVLVAPNGNDHGGIHAQLAELIGAVDSGLTLRIGSLPEVLDAADTVDVATWRGELRSGARANLLPGVLSARLPLKRLGALAAIELERYAEPLVALSDLDPGRLLDRAWRRMVENAGHDSITGCGADAVAHDVAARYTQARHIAELLAADGLADLAGRVDTMQVGAGREGLVVFNPSPRSRNGVIEVTAPMPGGGFVSADGTHAAIQPLEVTDRVALDMDVRGEQLLRLVPMVASRQLAGLVVNGLRIESGRTTTIRLDMGLELDGAFDVEAAKRAVEDLARARPRARFHVVGNAPPVARMLVAVPEVPGLGWTVLGPGTEPAPGAGARIDRGALDNGVLRVSVADNGTVRIQTADGLTLAGLLEIRDDGDAGDEYTFAPPRRDFTVSEPAETVVEEVADGPVEASLRIRRTYQIPSALTAGGSARARRRVAMPVTTTLALRTGERFVRATIELDNRARDHRVRAIFPLPFEVAGSSADGAFSVDARAPVGEGGPNESGSPVFPSRRWVEVSDGSRGLAVLHVGAPAYELIDPATLAITLVRSVGWLSRHGLPTRAGPAGPVIATPGAQVQGTHRVELALYPHEGDWRSAGVSDQAERFTLPLRAIPTDAHVAPLPASDGALAIEPACVHLSALTRTRDTVHVRVWNESNDAVRAKIRVRAPLVAPAASKVDLLGEEMERLEVVDAAIAVPLRAWEIATIALAR